MQRPHCGTLPMLQSTVSEIVKMCRGKTGYLGIPGRSSGGLKVFVPTCAMRVANVKGMRLAVAFNGWRCTAAGGP